MQTLPLRVTDEGYTIIDPDAGRPVRCAVGWKDQEAYERLLVDTLLGGSSHSQHHYLLRCPAKHFHNPRQVVAHARYMKLVI